MRLRVLGLMLVSLLLSIPAVYAKKNSNEPLEYELTGAGVGTQGTYLVRVTVTSKNAKIEEDVLMKAAVHGVLFKGFADSESRITNRPMAGSASVEAEHSDFFIPFFETDKLYKGYASVAPSSRSVTKSGKQYKVSATVTVMKDQLHRDLEKAGVIKGLNTIF